MLSAVSWLLFAFISFTSSSVSVGNVHSRNTVSTRFTTARDHSKRAVGLVQAIVGNYITIPPILYLPCH